ncbi:L,D-transpeptidase family protein [Suttonella ornithocola]|uniref:Probable L,D-transpeptidase YbiS n=1 Tax=Suttonella ornithocola TaxID=279832 RepID=A0A380MW95_9GAMM|nr:L,D-transpeptidase family protein [Suttonella ornithocola]SUO95667.1 Probable L,D-transpeptidase YbiS precursor [Suttonella ornithocola]
MKKWLFACLLGFVAISSQAEKFILPPDGVDLVGMVRQVTAKQEDTVLDIGRSFGVGVEAMQNANPSVDIWYPGEGTKVLVPTRYILPDVPHEGIVINLPEMRLYYFPKDEKVVYVYAVGIGREDWATPLGVQTITEKRPNPTWTPPASIRAEHAAKGDPLPAVVAAGPNNPLGLFAMRLSNPSYLIHGTNKPWGVGMRVSHGCIRMFPEGIEELFKMVPKGEKVNIIKQEMKVGWFGDELYLEYHPPIDEDNLSAQAAMQQALDLVNQKAAERGLTVSEDLIRAVVNEASGMPVSVAYSH